MIQFFTVFRVFRARMQIAVGHLMRATGMSSTVLVVMRHALRHTMLSFFETPTKLSQ